MYENPLFGISKRWVGVCDWVEDTTAFDTDELTPYFIAALAYPYQYQQAGFTSVEKCSSTGRVIADTILEVKEYRRMKANFTALKRTPFPTNPCIA